MSEPEPEPVITVFLTNAVRTSQGRGPGGKQLPAHEANALLRAKMAVAGDRPPRDHSDGGSPANVVAADAEFRENTHLITPRGGLL